MKQKHAFSAICGLIVFSVASIVIYGWHGKIQALTQIDPSFAPMQYNTALGFLLCSLGLVSLILKQRIIGQTLGILVAILGGATLSQYIFDVNFGIDNLFVDPHFLTKTTHPGLHRGQPMPSCMARSKGSLRRLKTRGQRRGVNGSAQTSNP